MNNNIFTQNFSNLITKKNKQQLINYLEFVKNKLENYVENLVIPKTNIYSLPFIENVVLNDFFNNHNYSFLLNDNLNNLFVNTKSLLKGFSFNENLNHIKYMIIWYNKWDNFLFHEETKEKKVLNNFIKMDFWEKINVLKNELSFDNLIKNDKNIDNIKNLLTINNFIEQIEKIINKINFNSEDYVILFNNLSLYNFLNSFYFEYKKLNFLFWENDYMFWKFSITPEYTFLFQKKWKSAGEYLFKKIVENSIWVDLENAYTITHKNTYFTNIVNKIYFNNRNPHLFEIIQHWSIFLYEINYINPKRILFVWKKFEEIFIELRKIIENFEKLNYQEFKKYFIKNIFWNYLKVIENWMIKNEIYYQKNYINIINNILIDYDNYYNNVLKNSLLWFKNFIQKIDSEKLFIKITNHPWSALRNKKYKVELF